MQTKLVLKQRSAMKLRFQPGATGPQGPQGIQGIQGVQGYKGWSPILATVADGVRRVLQVTDWTGGEGTKPATGSYIGASGLVTDIASAVDIRGAQGPSGSVTDGDKGDITVSGSGTAWAVDANAVTDAKLRDSAALSVIGRAANSSGDPADIAAATDGHVLRRSGTTLGFGTVATAGITDDAVTNAKLANMATGTIKGRTTALTGDPEDLTATQATALLNAMVGDSGAGGTKGLAPAPAAGDAAAGKYLHADGTWKAPASAGAVRYDASQSLSTGEKEQARSNIAAMPQPQTAVGVGQIVKIKPPADNGYNLPAGGIWEWWAVRFAVSGNVYNGWFESDVSPGGSNIAPTMAGSYYLGRARRVL